MSIHRFIEENGGCAEKQQVNPLFFLLFLRLALAGAGESFHDEIERLRGTPEFHSFEARDGTKLVYSVIDGQQGAPANPVIIVQGKGETIYRYVEFADEMRQKGYGPFYVLDHRGQGFSEQVLPDSLHVATMDTFVEDFIKFVDEPVRADLVRRGISAKPVIVAHSMGGNVAELALRRRPDLARSVAYVSPMFDINLGPFMAALNNKPVEYLAYALTRLGLGELRIGRDVNAPPSKKHGRSARRLKQALAVEREMNIHTPKVSVSWVNAALKGTERSRDPVGQPRLPAVIFQAERDFLVGNPAMTEYACSAENCLLVQLPGTHALHQGMDPVRHTLESRIDEFFREGDIKDPGVGCKRLYRVLKR